MPPFALFARSLAVALVLAAIPFRYVGWLLTREVPPSADEREEAMGTYFAGALERLGATFVKLGQILSTRADVLPADFIASLSRLQDQVPPFAFDEVGETKLPTRTFEKSLSLRVGDIFARYAHGCLR